MNYIFPIIVVFIGSFFGAVAALFLKNEANKKRAGINLLNGLFLYGISALIFIGALKFAPVSMLSPVSSATYVWSYIFAKKYLKEKITIKKIIGISMIICGIIVMALSQKINFLSFMWV